jgi:3-oxoacyl-(acyl-carrier-protein) synthase
MILDNEPCRPFDSTRAGLNLGEGAGYLVIEDEADAIARGAQILAYVGGYANTCDAFHQTASSENGEGAYLAMSKAIRMAQLQPQDIDYINAHGTATPNNDLSESAALMRLFGSQMPAISSTKAFTGHTTSASGGLEAAFCVMALREGFIPANLRWAHTAEGLIQPIPHTMRQPLHHVLCNAFGFGGNESSLVLCDQAVDLSVANIQQGKMQQVVSVEHIAPEEITALVSAAEARRMTVQTRQLVAVARKALRLAGIEMPDAILCATQWGCMQQSMRFLLDMLQTNEQELKPTPFIQSTHNTIASMIAIQTGNHGYNITYAQGVESYASAVQDVTNQMALGRIRTALILEFDELVPEWDEVLEHIHSKTQNIARAHVFNYQS